MAYDFTATSSQHLTTQSTPVVGYPVTMACWFNSKDITTSYSLLCLCNSSGTLERRYNLIAAGGVAGDPVRYIALNSQSAFVDTTAGYAANTWNHACAVSASTTSHSVFLNGGSRSNSSSFAGTTALIDTVAIGSRFLSSFGSFANARIAEVGIWSAALTEPEILSLATGVSPSLVRPQSLVFYAPLVRDLLDRARNLVITNNNSATVANHPRIYI